MTETAPNPQQILQTSLGFFASKTALSAIELGVFEALGPGPLEFEPLRDRLGLYPRAAADFLDALVALGFLTRAGDGAAALYANAPDTAVFLDPASPAYLGGFLEMANQRLYGFWGSLTEALRTGQQQNEGKHGVDVFGAVYADPARLEQFLAAMAGLQRESFKLLAERHDFSRVGTVCDIGGASGALCIELARRHPHLRCISVDLPAVTPIAKRTIAEAGLSDRIDAKPGDFLHGALPSADVVAMCNVLHDWGTETKRALIAKAYAALPEGGVFLVVENIIDDARRENTFGLLMSLNMLIETPGVTITRSASSGSGALQPTSGK